MKWSDKNNNFFHKYFHPFFLSNEHLSSSFRFEVSIDQFRGERLSYWRFSSIAFSFFAPIVKYIIINHNLPKNHLTWSIYHSLWSGCCRRFGCCRRVKQHTRYSCPGPSRLKRPNMGGARIWKLCSHIHYKFLLARKHKNQDRFTYYYSNQSLLKRPNVGGPEFIIRVRLLWIYVRTFSHESWIIHQDTEQVVENRKKYFLLSGEKKHKRTLSGSWIVKPFVRTTFWNLKYWDNEQARNTSSSNCVLIHPLSNLIGKMRSLQK